MSKWIMTENDELVNIDKAYRIYGDGFYCDDGINSQRYVVRVLYPDNIVINISSVGSQERCAFIFRGVAKFLAGFSKDETFFSVKNYVEYFDTPEEFDETEEP